MQKAHLSLLDETQSYTDNLKVNAYIRRRHVDRMGWYDTVGLEGKIPLDFSTDERRKVKKLEQNAHRLAQKSFESIVRFKLIRMMEDFSRIKRMIRIDKEDIRFLKKRIQHYETIRKNMIPNLNYDPEEKIVKLHAEVIDTRHRIALKKIELFKILGNMAYLSNTPDIKLLIKGYKR